MAIPHLLSQMYCDSPLSFCLHFPLQLVAWISSAGEHASLQYWGALHLARHVLPPWNCPGLDAPEECPAKRSFSQRGDPDGHSVLACSSSRRPSQKIRLPALRMPHDTRASLVQRTGPIALSALSAISHAGYPHRAPGGTHREPSKNGAATGSGGSESRGSVQRRLVFCPLWEIPCKEKAAKSRSLVEYARATRSAP